MKHANISNLKAHLSEYLDKVRRGETVVVFDRKTPIARILPYEEYLDDFRVEKAKRPPRDIKKIRGIRLRHPVDVVKLLRESRDQR